MKFVEKRLNKDKRGEKGKKNVKNRKKRFKTVAKVKKVKKVVQKAGAHPKRHSGYIVNLRRV